MFPDPTQSLSDDDLEWMVRLALESRRRVKEQQKRVFKSEFRNTHFSYILGADGVEQFVSTPELHSDEAIESDPLPPGQVSPQAIHLCLHAFSEDVEAAEAAHAAVLEYYIKTKRHLEAGTAARASMQRTLQYRAKLREVLAVAQRDITTLNYRGEVLPEFDRALDHIHDRVRWEGSQFSELQTRLVSLSLATADQQALTSACAEGLRLTPTIRR